MIMKLSKEDVDLYYKLHWSLLSYVNQKYRVIGGSIEPVLMHENPQKVWELYGKLFSNIELIDSFGSENPFNFNREELDIVRSWKNYVKDRFLIVAHLKDYSVFMTNGEDQKAYGVLGLIDEIEDVVPPFMPLFVETILFPFKSRIIYCGLMSTYNIHIGSNMRRSIQAEYQKAKSKFGIINSLDKPVMEKKESDEELLRYYLRSASRRMEYEYEIHEILEKNPALGNVYSLEIGRSYAKEAGKKLSQIGASTTWFAVFEDIVIASGKSEEEARERAYAVVPQDKRAGVHVFRHGRK
ncbi:Uncharacterised protein [uncultured archaeon]|nr:Uncharacterised protein [uncultured archaeon]